MSFLVWNIIKDISNQNYFKKSKYGRVRSNLNVTPSLPDSQALTRRARAII